MGRPKKLKKEDYITVEKLAKTGLTKEMIADYLDYSYSTMYEDKRFSEAYKKGYAVVGTKVRTTLLSKMEHDTTANIYLDKVMNKTIEKYQEERLEIEKERLKLEKEKFDNVDINDPEFILEILKKLPKEKLEEIIEKL